MNKDGELRTAFMRTSGVALFADVNIGVLGEIEQAHIAPVDESICSVDIEDIDRGINQANIGLFRTMQQLARTVPYRGGNAKNFDAQFGIDEEDRMQTREIGLLESGFGDMTFTWQFAPALANSVVQEWVKAGKITEEEASNLTLEDWANIIGSGWFSSLALSFAFSATNVFRDFGGRQTDYEYGAFSRHLSRTLNIPERETNLFSDFDEKLEPVENILYLTATIDPNLKSKLRKSMHTAGNSVGCPAARKSAIITNEMARSDRHFSHLVELGHAAINSEGSGDHVIFHQEYSAIERTLVAIANQLDRYSTMYGTPALVWSNKHEQYHLAHMSLPITNAIRKSI